MDDVLSAVGIAKRYGGVPVLSDVDFAVRPGEVHALIGENGAGKSTLIKILSGGVRPDGGRIVMAGRDVTFAAPADARRAGVVTIFQELAIVPGLSVAENIVLGNEPGSGPGRQFFSRRRANDIAARMLARLGGTAIDPRRPAGRLSTAERQLVEIARALALDAPVIVMDEPTASLSPREADALLGIVRQLRDAGKSVVFVSHRLNEVLAIADRITVLRGGERIATVPAAGVGIERLIELMVGRPVATLYPQKSRSIGAPVLRVTGLARAGAFRDIAFELRAGEVLGLAGLVGAGRTEIMRAIFGLDRADAGAIEVGGKAVRFRSPADAIAAGLAFVTEDRKDDGLILPMSGRENLVLAAPGKAASATIVRRGAIRAVTEGLRGDLNIRGRLDLPVLNLSGGNQQKIVLGRWMLADTRILILDEPTRGIDVGAKAEVYRLIHRLAGEGVAILMVSSELPELMNVAHRILVVSGGRIEAEFPEGRFDEKEILRAAFRAHLGHAAAVAA